jgi:hypothetical protein
MSTNQNTSTVTITATAIQKSFILEPIRLRDTLTQGSGSGVAIYQILLFWNSVLPHYKPIAIINTPPPFPFIPLDLIEEGFTVGKGTMWVPIISTFISAFSKINILMNSPPHHIES